MKKRFLNLSLAGLISISGLAYGNRADYAEIFGSNFQQTVVQDQTDINRFAIGGVFLSDYFAPFFKLHHSIAPFNTLQNRIQSEQQYFNKEANKEWLSLLISIDSASSQPINLNEVLVNFNKLVNDMYMYLDRTLIEKEREHTLRNLFDKIAATAQTYNIEIDTFYDGIKDGRTVTMQEPVRLLEDVIGRPNFTVITEKDVVRNDKKQTEIVTKTFYKEKGRLELMLEELNKKLKNVLVPVDAAGNTSVVWAKKQDAEGNDTEEDLANETIKAGLIAELQRLSEMTSGLITIVENINIPQLASLYINDQLVSTLDQSIISQLNEQQPDSIDSLSNELVKLENSVNSLKRMVERIYNYAY